MKNVRHLSGRFALALGALGLALALPLPRAARAAEGEAALPSPLKPDDVLVYARAHRAEISAAKAKSAAAVQTPKIVSALPDPMIMASVDHLPFMLNGVNWSVLIQQDFPLGGVLGARGRAAEAEARAVSADEKSVQLEVEFQALGAYLMWIELQRMAVVVDEQLAIAKQIDSIAKIRLSVSEAAAADVVRAQADVSKLEGERTAIEAEQTAAKSMLNASLGRAVGAAIPAPDLTMPVADPPVVAELVKLANDKRPEIVAMNARVDGARARIDEMNAMYAPMAFVRTGYAQTMEDGPGVMLMVGVSVPIWREKLSAGVAEAKSMTVMAESDVSAMKKMIEGEVASARDAVVAARVRLATTRDKVLPLARQALQLTITSYGSGQVPLVSVLDAEKLVRDTRMDEVVAELKVAVAWAKLGRSIGVVKVGVP